MDNIPCRFCGGQEGILTHVFVTHPLWKFRYLEVYHDACVPKNIEDKKENGDEV